jgi:hypothetical protein
MVTTRSELIERLLTEDCRKALAEVNDVIGEIKLDEFQFDGDDMFVIHMETRLYDSEAALVREVLEAAGWKSVKVKDSRVQFNF